MLIPDLTLIKCGNFFYYYPFIERTLPTPPSPALAASPKPNFYVQDLSYLR